MCCSVNVSVCFVCCVFYSVCELFSETIRNVYIAPIAQMVSALDLVTSSEQVEGSILTTGKKLSLKNLNVIIRAIN